ncbi:MAG: 16S rRNA-processing protein RimM [uncultured bacterium]|nr:MAG: 16S rRNA-processing protein RimM [uncultured bacterium]
MFDPVIIGSFGKTFGVRGWIKINSFAIPRKNILDFKPWLIQKNNSWEEFYFTDSRQHVDSIVVKLPNCNSPEEARAFTNIKIGVWRKQLPKLQIDEYYWTDLVGLKVINSDGVDLGVVQALMATGANDVLVVMGDRKRLIPYISDVILKVDLAKKIIRVDWEQDF